MPGSRPSSAGSMGTIYGHATRIGTPQSIGTPVGTGDVDDRVITKKYVRQVEVPFTREVKVPVTTHKLEPTTTIERVPVRKLIEVPGHKWVDQEYIDVEEQELVRDKVVWVKKVIPEKYIGQVEVKKTRKVKVPTTLIKEVREMVEVVVPTNKLVEERGWRIDQVQDRKLVEVEEHRKFRLVPEPTGEVHIADKRELGRTSGKHITRTRGAVYTNEEDVGSVSNDSQSDRASYLADRLESARMGGEPSGGYGSLIGVLMYNAEPHGTGCRVARVHYNQPAWHAGIRENDIITAMNGDSTANLDQFRGAILRSGTLLRLTLRRQANYMGVSLTRKKLPF